MADRYDYALLSGWAYYRTPINQFENGTLGWTEVARFPGGDIPDDPATGFSAAAYKKGNEIVIAFAGTNELIKDFSIANVPAGLGLFSPQVAQAMTFALDVMLDNPGASISFTGHSLGSGLAYLAEPLLNFERSPIFNPLH